MFRDLFGVIRTLTSQFWEDGHQHHTPGLIFRPVEGAHGGGTSMFVGGRGARKRGHVLAVGQQGCRFSILFAYLARCVFHVVVAAVWLWCGLAPCVFPGEKVVFGLPWHPKQGRFT